MYYLTTKNGIGTESRWCRNGTWVTSKYTKFPDEYGRDWATVKVWKTKKGVRRWLAERPEMMEYVTIEERAK